MHDDIEEEEQESAEAASLVDTKGHYRSMAREVGEQECWHERDTAGNRRGRDGEKEVMQCDLRPEEGGQRDEEDQRVRSSVAKMWSLR